MAYGELGLKGDGDGRKSELWQEVRYHPQLFPEIKRDRWGERRACQMLVVAPPKKETKDSSGQV
eukprot:CAMPEP_0196176942 /NCGR_PEP_ID=MMETSP0911-20130528/9021_1 /TAXON_ID=49265 /ORGANISM="Thalassiosira rotula, Strain GSO102" /LENGTH=63 /DNA_ID=CAMNT_0041444745 /DNA_START=18 /DNA_END=205 /DNA_ORIENTATION=+